MKTPQSPSSPAQPYRRKVDSVPGLSLPELSANKSHPKTEDFEIERLTEKLAKTCRTLPIKRERRLRSEVASSRSFDKLAEFHAQQARSIEDEVQELSDATKARHKFSEENQARFARASKWKPEDQQLMCDIIRGDEGVDVIGAACAMAKEASSRELVLEALKDRGLGSVDLLAELVVEGVPGAAEALVTLVRESVEVLKRTSTRCKTVFAQVAKKEVVWASLRSHHPQTEKLAVEHFNDLQVGKENVVLIDSSARSLLADPLGRVTLQLIAHI